MIENFSLYVHIPFCHTKCPYCDFNTYAKIESLIPSYIDSLNREIVLWGEFFGERRPLVKTIFFGGGTPSYLPSEDIRSVMETISAAFDVAPDAEVTLEANPGDFTDAKLKTYLDCGINRLSIGVQSFKDDLLKTLGRRHSVAEAQQAYHMANDAGFDNVSIDLMYGLPYQSIGDWQQTLESALELAPLHISMYALTLEGGTPMEQWVESGTMPEADSDLAADMYQMAQDCMRERGYRHYEISNWAKPGYESRHNLTYWRNQPYIGVGPGAHSYLPPHRFFNIKSPREYVRKLREATTSASLGSKLNERFIQETQIFPKIQKMAGVEDVEIIDKNLEVAETLMLGLRLDTGISEAEFADRFGAPPSQFHGETIDELVSLGLLEAHDGCLRLTHRGRMMGNQVFSRFFV